MVTGRSGNIHINLSASIYTCSPVQSNDNFNHDDLQVNISVPDDEWFEEWTSDDFVALPERVDVAYENEHYNPKLQYLTGVSRDDASFMICKSSIKTTKLDTSLNNNNANYAVPMKSYLFNYR